ncbi:E1 ubiquitin-activating protein uba2 [Tulasnella sp. 427]|nr:E1 ubiquitin-activating protein uba2 [Tulasnella sp. 427]
MPRNTHALAILGPKLVDKLAQTRVLMVGAGGIGCELLKNVVLTGFGDITLLDLDTIDLSNLNRQFLFRKKDVKKSKALVAAQTAQAFNPSCKITPIHGNIKEDQFDVNWFKSFDIVLNALDNLGKSRPSSLVFNCLAVLTLVLLDIRYADARRHVNKMCMAANIPLVESGTAGYLGQVQPILRDSTECFDCMPKPTPKTFPVCTIRSTPSTPIHCIVWAKSYLLPQLFGEQEDDESELDQAALQGENATEIANLRKEARAFKQVRDSLLSSPPEQAAALVFNKVFNDDIKRLLSMSDMWKARKPPTSLDRELILADKFAAPAVPAPSSSEKSGPAAANVIVNGTGSSTIPNGGVASSSSRAKLKDQRQLSLKDNVELFDESLSRLAARLRSGKETNISFDKDDPDTLDFVTATANLRAVAYAIENKTRWEVKEMAGNIIPAIATTNAIISGLIVLQALHILRAKATGKPIPVATPSQPSGIRISGLQAGKPSIPLATYYVSPPNPSCGICRDQYVAVQCDPARTKLGDLINAVLRAERGVGEDDAMANREDADDEDDDEEKREVSVYEGQRLLYDPDMDDNLGSTLERLGCTRGKFLTIVDEDEVYENVVDENSAQSPAFILPSSFPSPKQHARPKPPASATVEDIENEPEIVIAEPSKKRAASDDDLPPAKRARTVEQPQETDDGHVIISDDDDDVMEVL